jgi:2-iminobutanoate/2-iminopropanoate deaminase
MKKIIILLLLQIASCTNNQNNSSNEISEIEYYTSDSTKEVDFPFSDATIVNNIIYVSGQVGNIPGETKVVEGGIREETKQTIRNIENILVNLGSSLDKVFKCTCMLSDISEWAEMSDEYKKYFNIDKRPSRSAFAGSGLALGAKVEIECWATK